MPLQPLPRPLIDHSLDSLVGATAGPKSRACAAWRRWRWEDASVDGAW